jgi:hypothetical protein
MQTLNRPRSLPAFVLASFAAAFLAAAMILPGGGCGGSGDDEAAEGSRKSRKRSPSTAEDADPIASDDEKEEKRSSRSRPSSGDDSLSGAVESLIEEAKTKGIDKLFPEDFQKAESLFARGRTLVDNGNAAAAKKLFTTATRDIKFAIQRASEVQSELKAAEAEKKHADEAKVKANEVEAAVNARNYYRDALAAYKQAEEASARKTVEAVRAAVTDYRRAAQLFEDATSLSHENARERKLAEVKKGNMQRARDLAKAQGADTKAITVWAEAESQSQTGDVELEGSNFAAASAAYQTAERAYLNALQSTMDKDAFERLQVEIARQNEEDRKRYEEREKERLRIVAEKGGGREPLPPPAAEPGAGRAPLPPPTSSGTPSPSVGLIGGVSCTQGLDRTLYPQEIDAEDEAFLIENISRLSSVAVYDPDTGGILLNYQDGRKLQKEADLSRIRDKKHVSFIDPLLASAGKDLDPSALYSLAGNTQGILLFPVPFRYRVRVTWDMQIETMSNKADFGPMLCLDPKKNSFYRTDFIHLLMFTGGQPKFRQPMAGAKFAKHADQWHTKQRPVRWVVELAVEGADRPGTLTATYDQGNEDEATNTASISKPRERGLVGFTWKEVRFKLRNLEVCGILDKPEAVRILREKLGVKKEAAGKDDAEKEGTAKKGGKAAKPEKSGKEPAEDEELDEEPSASGEAKPSGQKKASAGTFEY